MRLLIVRILAVTLLGGMTSTIAHAKPTLEETLQYIKDKLPPAAVRYHNGNTGIRSLEPHVIVTAKGCDIKIHWQSRSISDGSMLDKMFLFNLSQIDPESVMGVRWGNEYSIQLNAKPGESLLDRRVFSPSGMHTGGYNVKQMRIEVKEARAADTLANAFRHAVRLCDEVSPLPPDPFAHPLD